MLGGECSNYFALTLYLIFQALELLMPPVPSNADDRLEAHKIRGMAFQQLDLPLEGVDTLLFFLHLFKRRSMHFI